MNLDKNCAEKFSCAASFAKGRAWIELDRKHLHQNIAALNAFLPKDCDLMPVLKANAYGHGAVLIAKELNRAGIRSFCVATVSEGIALRRSGVKGEILILGYTHSEQFPLLRKYRLTQTVTDSSYASQLDSYGKKLRVHIKIDTGMHRLGEPAQNTEKIREIFCHKNLSVTGIYTHLCAADGVSEKEREFTRRQGSIFWHMVSMLQKDGCPCGKPHLLASYGLLCYPELGGAHARIGIALYGMLSSREDSDHCPVRLYPVLSLRARVAQVKTLCPGESAGYGLQFIAKQNCRIAVLSIGYADGIPRSLSNGVGSVLIKGQPAPVIGCICMDQMLVDVTKIPQVTSSDIATLIGKDGEYEITACDLAKEAGTITNEILSRLGSRLERSFVT